MRARRSSTPSGTRPSASQVTGIPFRPSFAKTLGNSSRTKASASSTSFGLLIFCSDIGTWGSSRVQMTSRPPGVIRLIVALELPMIGKNRREFERRPG